MKYAFACLFVILVAGLHLVQAQVPVQQVQERMHFTEEELTDLGDHLETHPNDHLSRRQYADALFEFKRYREAASQYEQYLQHYQGSPDTVHRFLIAIASYPGDNERGERAAAKYLAFYPSDHELHMRLGYFRLWQSKYTEAIEAFEEALKIAPGHVESQNGLVEAEAGAALNERLDSSLPVTVSDPAEYPQLDERRYRFIHELMHHQRYSAAFNELMILAERHDSSRRWLALFAQIDAALLDVLGQSPAFPIDRYRYLLRYQPDHVVRRYALVDALVEENRIGEAYEVLVNPQHVNPADSGYVTRLRRIDEKRATWVAERIEEVRQQLDERPESADLISELIDLYRFDRRHEATLPLYSRWLSLDSTNASVRYQYTLALFDSGLYQAALDQAATLVALDASDPAYLNAYTRSALATSDSTRRALVLLTNYIEEHPEEVDVLLDLSELYLYEGQPLKADTLLRRAYTIGLPADRLRLYALDHRIASTLVRQEKERERALREKAMELAASSSYEEAIEQFEAYLDARGVRTYEDLEELAHLYSMSGDYEMALSIQDALRARRVTARLWKNIARNRYYMGDHAGALMELEAFIREYPRDAEAMELLQQVYIEVQRYKQADSVSATILTMSDESTLDVSYRKRVRESINLIERSISTDYVGLLVPVSYYTRAKGSITSYEHWGQGLLTQVTLPADPHPFVVTAGLVSHFVEGTRRLVPGTASSLSRINQVILGSYFDLTAPPTNSSVGYTNRLWFQFGVFDYSGGRTSGFADFMYLRHEPRRYTASIGVHDTEGALLLWSPAGGEFGLRLRQLEVNAHTKHILPDSSLRVSAQFDLNLVKGIRDSTSLNRERNTGTDTRLEVSYRFFRNTYLGLSYNGIHYRQTLETYFSPKRYRSYDIWLEYENELIGKWYIRSRLTTGLVSYRRGAFAARIESDLIYRLTPQVSFSVNGSAGYSVRFLNGEETLRDERFRLAFLTAALYWTL